LTGERVVRRLAAILAADVVGYSRLMGRDESGTLARLREHRKQRFEPILARHSGRLVKLTGDGALVEFSSAVDALSAAIEFQQAMAEANRDRPEDSRIVFRVGLHLGDLIVDGDDLYGDGVNVAARLEAEAPAGGIVVSRAIREAVDGRLKAKLHALGELSLKNIERPIRAFRVEWEAADWKATAASTPKATQDEPTTPATPALALPDKPSIAVLPFQNMSGDPEQEYFADGVAEDVLTTLSKIEELMVIARNSSFVFRGQSRDVREIGRILGVRYVLEGSVRKSGNRVRLTAQLIDGLDGSHVWADRFDGDLDDVFELQDRITQDIVSALEVRLTLGEQARVWRKRSGSPMVYEHFSKAASYYNQFGKHTHAQAKEACERALAINPGYTPVLLFLGLTLVDQARFGWVADAAAAYKAALECADRALQADPESSDGYMIKGYACTFLRRHDEATEAGQKAIALGPRPWINTLGANFMSAHCNVRSNCWLKSIAPSSITTAPMDNTRSLFRFSPVVSRSSTTQRCSRRLHSPSSAAEGKRCRRCWSSPDRLGPAGRSHENRLIADTAGPGCFAGVVPGAGIHAGSVDPDD